MLTTRPLHSSARGTGPTLPTISQLAAAPRIDPSLPRSQCVLSRHLASTASSRQLKLFSRLPSSEICSAGPNLQSPFSNPTPPLLASRPRYPRLAPSAAGTPAPYSALTAVNQPAVIAVVVAQPNHPPPTVHRPAALRLWAQNCPPGETIPSSTSHPPTLHLRCHPQPHPSSAASPIKKLRAPLLSSIQLAASSPAICCLAPFRPYRHLSLSSHHLTKLRGAADDISHARHEQKTPPPRHQHHRLLVPSVGASRRVCHPSTCPTTRPTTPATARRSSNSIRTSTTSETPSSTPVHSRL